MLAAAAANIGTVLFLAGVETAVAANVAFGFTGLFGLMALGSLMKVLN
jgi:hypothetical protein